MDTGAPADFWKKCSSCKKPIDFKQLYWVCNVSTCNRKRTGLAFCSVSCWDAHVPMMNHRESWAEERRAPSREEWERILSGEDEKPRKKAPAEQAKEETSPVPESNPKPLTPKVIIRRRSP